MIHNNEILHDTYIEEFLNTCRQENTIYVKPGVYALSSRKLEALLKIAELQKYYQCNPVRFINDFFNIELLDAQAWVIQRSWNCPNVLLVCTRGFGKALSLDTRIPTPQGDKTIKDINIGDYVFDENGQPVKVINISPIFKNHDCYKIRFSDNEEIIADADHIWSVYDRWQRNRNKLIEIKTSDMYEKYIIPKRKTYSDKWDKDYNEVRYSVPMSKPVDFKEKKLGIHPYILGLWLGDGCSKASYITSHVDDYEEICEHIKECGYKIYSITNDSGNNKKITIHNEMGVPLCTTLKEMNLFNNKHIPEEYLYSSIQQRLSLLQGFMDSDGTIKKEGYAEFTQSVDKTELVDGFRRLLVSLGIKFTDGKYERKCNGEIFYAQRFCFTPSKEMPCFRLKRKYDRLKEVYPKTSHKKQIVYMEKIDSVPTKCISVDGDSHLFLCGEKNTVTHNSTIIDIMVMAKDMLFNNYWTYIASGSGSQAEQTFTTLERLANDNIDTMIGSTGYIFKQEIEIKNAAGDGFSHSSNGFSYNLYNGSMTQTLNSNVDKKRGMRGNVVFDECGFLDEEMMSVYAAFAIVNKSFASGKDRDGNSIDMHRLRCIPDNIPNQLFYISSASSTDTEFYKLYRDFSKRQLMGDPNYFVAHIDCEVAFKPTIRGQVMAPLLSKDTVEAAMRSNPEKARREYYCEFTSDAGANAIIRRGAIARNEVIRKPVLYNDTGERKVVILYDPARSRDNSVILVAEIYDFINSDGIVEKKMRLLNCINLIDIEKKNKKPMRTPEQIEYLKQVILDYNQGGDENYSNIMGVYIDAGSGGAGVNIADFLMPDWKSKNGTTHKGLIDKEYSADYVKNFPNAVNKLHLISPSQYKSEMYEAMIELIDQDKVEFTATYDNKGYLTILEVDESKLKQEKTKITEKLKKLKLSEDDFKAQLQEELSKIQNVKTRIVKLSWQEEVALVGIDALKEELVNMVRIKRDSGKDSFELCPEKKNKMNDDRAYVCAMACYALMCERRKFITHKRKPKNNNMSSIFAAQIKVATRRKGFF